MFKKILLMLVVIMGLVIFFLTYSYAAINSDFTPKWKTGDSWDVATRTMSASIPANSKTIEAGGYIEHPGEPSYVHFEVVGIKDIDGEMCHILEITYKYPTNQTDRDSALHLYVRMNDFTLKRVLEITKGANGLEDHIDAYRNNGHDFVMFDMPLRVSIPCDFPNFPVTNINEERTVKVSSGLTVTQKAIFMDNDTLQIELSTKVGTRTHTLIQIWEKGKPWWSSVKRTYTYKDYGTDQMKTRVEDNILLVGVDKTPPVLNVTVIPATLWPPDHRMVDIISNITVTDDYDGYPDLKVKVTSNEPDDATNEGDGSTRGDIQIDRNNRVSLRAERDGSGRGRVYTITYTATDFSGNTAIASAIVTVPHDMGEKKK